MWKKFAHYENFRNFAAQYSGHGFYASLAEWPHEDETK